MVVVFSPRPPPLQCGRCTHPEEPDPRVTPPGSGGLVLSCLCLLSSLHFSLFGWSWDGTQGLGTERINEASASPFVYRRHTWVPSWTLQFLRKGGEGHCHLMRASVNGRHMKTAQEIASWGNKDQVSEVIEPLTKVFPVLKPSWTPASRVSSTAPSLPGFCCSPPEQFQ